MKKCKDPYIPFAYPTLELNMSKAKEKTPDPDAFSSTIL